MKWKPKEIQILEQLQAGGVSLDQHAIREAQAAVRGLKITSLGNPIEDVIYARASGGMGLTLAVAIENVSERAIRVVEIDFRLPWPDTNFKWLKKRSSKELSEHGGYTFPPFDPYGFDASVVLNHRFGRNFIITPGDSCEGLLLGESVWPVPDAFPDRTKIPAQLLVLVGSGRTFDTWVTLHVDRPKRAVIDKTAKRGAIVGLRA